MIEEIISFKERLDIISADCFQSDDTFTQAVKEALKFSINKRKNIPAELLAKFVNKLLRAGSKVIYFIKTLYRFNLF